MKRPVFSINKLILTFLIILSFPSGLGAQTPQPNQSVSAFWGSLRIPYSAVVSGLDYHLDQLSVQVPLGFHLRLESFGTFFTLGSLSFDASVIAAWRFEGPWSGTHWCLGGGWLVEARLVQDERTSAHTSSAPLLTAGMEHTWVLGPVDLTARGDGELAVYRDGAGLTVEPEVQLGWGWAFLSFRQKSRWLWALGNSTLLSEFRWDTYLGLGVRF